MKKNKKIILIFFGPPGSGKGTQAEMLSKKIKLPIFSTGGILRSEIKRKTIVGKKVENILASGGLVPNTIVERLLFKRFNDGDAKKGFILDGYPRKKSQLVNLLKQLKKITSDSDIVQAILVDVSDKEVISRLGGRRVCVCGKTYHIKFNPPQKKGMCNKCAQKLFIREDDRPKVIQGRLKLYHKEIAPILKYWEKNNQFIEINGNQKIEKVFKDMRKELRNI